MRPHLLEASVLLNGEDDLMLQGTKHTGVTQITVHQNHTRLYLHICIYIHTDCRVSWVRIPPGSVMGSNPTRGSSSSLERVVLGVVDLFAFLPRYQVVDTLYIHSKTCACA